jgi:hypothetical protein
MGKQSSTKKWFFPNDTHTPLNSEKHTKRSARIKKLTIQGNPHTCAASIEKEDMEPSNVVVISACTIPHTSRHSL